MDAVWRACYQTHPTYLGLLERPLNDYSASELERTATVDEAWRADDFPWVTQRSIVANKSGMMHLVDGGRWLLMLNRGTMVSYDLDAQSIEGTVLITPATQDDDVEMRHIVVYVDKEGATEEFMVALVQDSNGTSEYLPVFSVLFK